MSNQDIGTVIDNVTLTVHGTGDSEPGNQTSKWWEQNSDFANKLRTRFGSRSMKIHPFIWSGKNSQREREKAAKELAEFLSTRSGHLKLIAHSHGGNVTLRALSLLPEKQFNRVTLFLIGTPFIVQRMSTRMWLNVFFSLFASFFLLLFGASFLQLNIYDFQYEKLLHIVALTLLSFVLSYISIRLRLSTYFLLFSMLALAIVTFVDHIALTNISRVENVLSAGIFALSSFAFISFGKVIDRLSYDHKIRRVCNSRSVEIFDMNHPKDEVFELFESENRVDLKFVSRQFSQSAFRALVIYGHFGIYAFISAAVLQYYFRYHTADFLRLDAAVFIKLSSSTIGLMISFILTYALVEILSRYFANRNGMFLSNTFNAMLKSIIAGSSLGSDAFSATKYDPTQKFQSRSNISIPADVAEEMSVAAQQEANAFVSKLLEINTLRSAGVFGSIEDLEKVFSWKSLLHCRYFVTPFVVDMICDRILSTNNRSASAK